MLAGVWLQVLPGVGRRVSGQAGTAVTGCRAVQWLASGEAHTWPSFKQQPQKSLTRASASALHPRPLSLLTRSCFSSQDLIKVHHSFLRAIDVSMMAGGSSLAKVFLDFKER